MKDTIKKYKSNWHQTLVITSFSSFSAAVTSANSCSSFLIFSVCISISIFWHYNQEQRWVLNCQKFHSQVYHIEARQVHNNMYYWQTRNMFCGTWYLPHSHHNERTVPIIMDRCSVHARHSHTSTSAIKSNITIVFLNPDFLRGKNSGDSRTFKADIIIIINLICTNAAWTIKYMKKHTQ